MVKVASRTATGSRARSPSATDQATKTSAVNGISAAHGFQISTIVTGPNARTRNASPTVAATAMAVPPRRWARPTQATRRAALTSAIVSGMAGHQPLRAAGETNQ